MSTCAWAAIALPVFSIRTASNKSCLVSSLVSPLLARREHKGLMIRGLFREVVFVGRVAAEVGDALQPWIGDESPTVSR